jgi:hypothetical protein
MSQANAMVFDQLQSDPNFAVDFIVDNNPEEVLARLSGRNLLSVAPQEATKQTIKSDIRRISDEETLSEVLDVPYVNEASNYTGGYEDMLSQRASQKAAGVGVGIVNGILAVGQQTLGFLTQRAATQQQQIASEMQSEALQSQEEMLAAQQEFERQQQEKNRVLGLPLNAFITIVGSAAFIVVVAMLTRK